MPTYLRGFLPSLGAGGSLVGASLVVAAILSSVIAFQGWPAGVLGGDGGSVALEGTPAARPAPDRTQAAPATRVDGVTTPAVARRRGAARRAAGSGPTGRRRGSAPVRRPVATKPAPAASAPAAPAPAGPSGGGGSSAPPSSPHSTPPSQPPSSPPGGSGPLPDRPVGSVVDTVQQVVPPVPPAVQPVVDTVNQVADDTASTVDDTVGTVNGVVGGLLP
jgi:hypothetical protein